MLVDVAKEGLVGPLLLGVHAKNDGILVLGAWHEGVNKLDLDIVAAVGVPDCSELCLDFFVGLVRLIRVVAQLAVQVAVNHSGGCRSDGEGCGGNLVPQHFAGLPGIDYKKHAICY